MKKQNEEAPAAQDASVIYVGIDVSKESLSVDAPQWFVGEIVNDRKSIKAMLSKFKRKCGASEMAHVCFESTGSYGDVLLEQCHECGVLASVMNPANVRHFAKAMSETAKTDAIDARMIRVFAESRRPEPTPAPGAAEKKLRRLVLAHDALSKGKVRFGGVLESLRGSEAGKVLEKHVARLEKDIAALESAIEEVLKSDETLAGLSAELDGIKGVGLLTAGKVLAHLPEIGTLGRRSVASLAGLAPFTRQSGKWKGKSVTGGGRGELRRALFMPATVAIQHNPVLKAAYEKLKNKGKPYKIAITAIMRKLLCHMESVAAKWLCERAAKTAAANAAASD